MGVTTFVGGIAGGTWLALPIILVLGFLAGLLVCVSLEAGLIGMWATIAFVFIDGMHQSVHQGLLRALLVVAGALLQILLMVLYDALSRSNAETEGVIAVYQSLADFVRSPAGEKDLLVAGALLEADSRLRDSFLVKRQWCQLRGLTDLAESIRIEIVALVAWERDLAKSASFDDVDLPKLKVVREEFNAKLLAIAESLKRKNRRGESERLLGREKGDGSAGTNHLALKRDGIPFEGTHPTLGLEWEQVAVGIERVLADVERANVILSGGHHEESSAATDDEAQGLSEERMPPFGWIRDAYEAIRVNLSLGSSAFRHAIRLGSTLLAATLVYRVSPLPRGYWLALTVLVILRPEFSTTFTRGIARVIGTLMGALIATLLVAIPDPSHWLGVLLVGVFLWGMYGVLNYNLVLFICFLTSEVVVLLSYFEHVPPLATIADRILYTVAGSLLAWIAYIVWPTWQHKNVPLVFANLIAAERQYLHALLDPTNGGTPKAQMARLRKRTRLARTNAVNLVNQSALEPALGPLQTQAEKMALTALHRLSEGLMLLESRAFSYPGYHDLSLSEVMRFSDFMEAGLTAVEHEMRQGVTLGVNPETSKGSLDESSSLTKHEILQMHLPAPVTTLFVRMADNMATLYRTLP